MPCRPSISLPDFIPIIGYLDDLVIVPLGVLIVVRLIPSELMEEFRAVAAMAQERPSSRLAAALIVTIWLALGAASLYLLLR